MRGLWGDASRAYELLIRQYGGRPEANVARLALAQILLDHLGRPARALRLFETVRRRSRSLAEQAEWGRVRALLRLGRSGDAARAAAEYLRRHPTGLHAAAARRISGGTSGDGTGGAP